MLVLTRKIQQQIQIGDNIRITILQVKGRSVRVGIEAPRELRVSRVDTPASAQPSETTLEVTADIEPSRPATQVAQPKTDHRNRVEPFFVSPRQSRSELKQLVIQASMRRHATAKELPHTNTATASPAAVFEATQMLPTIMAAHAAC